MRVLVVEDEAKLANLLRRGLTAHGLAVDVAATGQDALEIAPATAYAVIVLDRMLPDIDGLQVCRDLRAAGVNTPVLMLTALGGLADRVDLLEYAWDETYENRSNVIDVYVGYLRAKIDRPFGGHSIVTVRGGGYRLDPAAS